MELIYGNNYGAFYKIFEAPNKECKLQLVVDTVGIFMSASDLGHFLSVIQDSDAPCQCATCKGGKCNKIWCSNPLVDICLKVSEPILEEMEDLVKGTQFILNMDETLKQYRIKN
ncbi:MULTISPECIES: hypothetical protein [Bacteroidota]|uniref:Uncharacterized protein n=1 Tax=Euzebyella saccharophila TaxID=679664 RepID=A0ABV8JMY9_9FLAO|nr:MULTISPECIES: hypothetical protein [Bacteroidota]MBC6998283.1 hypothetical protein [Cytophaga sp. FL35]